MTANNVLEAIRNQGITAITDGKTVKLKPMPEGNLLELVKEHKKELVRLLEIENLQDTALKIIELCPQAAEKIDALLGAAIAGNWEDTLELELKIVEAFARFLDPEYKAAIWGDRTWSEKQAGIKHEPAPAGCRKPTTEELYG